MEAVAAFSVLLHPSGFLSLVTSPASPGLAFSSSVVFVSFDCPSCHFVSSSTRCSTLSYPNATTAEIEEVLKFAEGSKRGSLLPLNCAIFFDLPMPFLAYRCFNKGDNLALTRFLFEYVKQDCQGLTVDPCSVVRDKPTIEIITKEYLVSTMFPEEGREIDKIVQDPTQIPCKIMEGWTPHLTIELPDAFYGEWVDFSSYGAFRHMEKKRISFSASPKDHRSLSDLCLGMYTNVITFDYIDKGGTVNQPFLGLIKRGKNDEEDKLLKQQLITVAMQCAEHIMLVDLEKNDIGRVAKCDSLKGGKLIITDGYSDIMHIFSTATVEMTEHFTAPAHTRTISQRCPKDHSYGAYLMKCKKQDQRLAC